MRKRQLNCLNIKAQYFLFLLIVVCGSSCISTQGVPEKEWDKVFGGTDYDFVEDIRQTSDNGYILGGTTYGGSNMYDLTDEEKGSTDFWILKLDSSGNRIWDKSFGGHSWSYSNFKMLQPTNNGGYILGGTSTSDIGGDKSQNNRKRREYSLASESGDYWVVKIDAYGNKLWDKTFGGGVDDRLNYIQLAPDGGYILAGVSNSDSSGEKTQGRTDSYYFDTWIVKIDEEGNKIWDKTIGISNISASYNSNPFTIFQQTKDGGYILGGSYYSESKNIKSKMNDYWILKLDSKAEVKWQRCFGGNGVDNIKSIFQTSDGGYIVGGTSDSDKGRDKSENSKGSSDFWILKLNKNGKKVWDKTLGSSKADQLVSIKQTLDKGYILTGYTDFDYKKDFQDIDTWLIKLNRKGSVIWERNLGSNGADLLWSIQQTSDKGFILAGGTESDMGDDKSYDPRGNHDFWIVKLGPERRKIKSKKNK